VVKRVSLKGKGADLFFGDYTPSGAPEGISPSEQPNSALPQPTSAEASDTTFPSPVVDPNEVPSPNAIRARKNARKKESTLARMQEGGRKPAVERAGKNAEVKAEPQSALAQQLFEGIWPSLAEPATLTNAFRYTEQELTGLNDVAYEVTKAHRVKLSKQDIARLGLNAVLWDYRARGEESLVSQFVRRRKQQRQGE
jgi:hypothetical protein